MPALSGLLVTLMGGMASFLSAWMAKKAAFALAAVATFGILTAALVAAMAALVATLLSTFPESGPFVASLIWTITPPMVPTSMAACVTCDAAVALYWWNTHNLSLASFTS